MYTNYIKKHCLMVAHMNRSYELCNLLEEKINCISFYPILLSFIN